MPEPLIAVVGATGFTGKLVVADLQRRGTAVRAIGRNPAKLDAIAAQHTGVETRAVAWNAAAIAGALEGCAAVIACAGPFAEVGHPAAEGAVQAGVPYCDSTGEQVFIRWVFDALDARARTAGIPMVPAAGFDYVPGDLGAAILGEGMGPLERIDIVYGTQSGATSVGTRVSTVGVMTSPGVAWRDGALQPLRIGSLKRTVDLGFATMTGGVIPSGEVVQVPRHVDVRNVYGYLALPGRMSPSSPGASLMGGVLKVPGATALLTLLARRGIEGPQGASRDKAVACHVQAQSLAGERRALLVEGTDPYGFTARSLAELALRLVAGPDATGACAPAEVVNPREFLAATGYTFREVPPTP